MQVAASVNLEGMKGRQQSVKSRWKDQAPTRIVPAEEGTAGSGNVGLSKDPSKKLQMGAEQVPSA